jgi:hypothetical protein
MHVLLLSPDEVLEKWGVIEEGTENETYKIVDTSDRSYGGAVSGRLYGKLLAVEKIHNTVRVYEEWELPSRKYPSGRLIICTDNNLLYYGSLPDKLGEHGEYLLPFDVQYSLRTDGFFGKSIIERLIPVQRALNSNKNRIQDYLNRIAIGVLVTEEGSVPNIDEFLTSGIMPGDIIEYMVGRHAPRFMDVPSLPADIFRETSDLLEQIDRLSGVSQLAKQSTVSPSISAASAIAGLAEQDDTRIGLEGENAKAAYISFTKKALILYHHNVKYPRMVADIGKNDEFEISQFRGNELTSFDVEIMPEPEAADTMATRRQKIIDLWNSGILKDPETGTLTSAGRAKLLEAMQFGDLDIFTDGDNVHVERAHRENQAMVAGDVCEVVEYDDDTIHIGSHNDFRLSAEYEDAAKKDPALNDRFEEHVNVHLANFEQKNPEPQIEQMEQAAQLPPTQEIT